MNKKSKRPSSITGMTLRQRFRRSWASWLLKRTRRKLEREQKRYQLMLLQMDYQLLKLKELEEKEALQRLVTMELEDRKLYRMSPPPEQPPPLTQEAVRDMLGLSTPEV